MLSLLWDGQRDDAARIKELKRECNELSNENAALQLDCFEKPHVTRIPQEVVVTETGRRYTTTGLVEKSAARRSVLYFP